MAISLKSLLDRRSGITALQGGTYNAWTRTATGAGTFNVPYGWSGLVYVTLVGGGGGGGGTSSTSYDGGGGGGGAVWYRWPLWIDYSVATSYTVTVGAGGTGSNSGAVDGTAGGNTTFGSWLTAYGGGGGQRGGIGLSYGGEGGHYASAGASNAVGHGTPNTPINAIVLEASSFPHPTVPLSFFCEGGFGGPGDEGTNNAEDGQSTLGGIGSSPNMAWPIHVSGQAIGVGGSTFAVDPVHYGRCTNYENNGSPSSLYAAQGGGGSLGYGGRSENTAGVAAQTNGGGGGAGEDSHNAGSGGNGADGLAIVEYFL